MIWHFSKQMRRRLGIFLVCMGFLSLCSIFFSAGTFQSDGETQKQAPRQIDPTKPMLALTFDDGPYAPSTERILEALEKVNGRATFFVVGSRIAGREETLQKIAQSGSEIGNHTFDHAILKDLSETEIQKQFAKTAETIEAVTGQKPSLLRCPGGVIPTHLQKPLPCPNVFWSIDTKDWSHQNAKRTADIVLREAKDGDIVLMHDLFVPTAEAVEMMLPELQRRGFQFVTVSELMQYRKNISVNF